MCFSKWQLQVFHLKSCFVDITVIDNAHSPLFNFTHQSRFWVPPNVPKNILPLLYGNPHTGIFQLLVSVSYILVMKSS